MKQIADGQERTKQSDEARELLPNDSVGFESLPHQMVKKRVQDGFAFNLLLIGETGIGKSTLISSLFHVPLDPPAASHSNSDMNRTLQTYGLFEKEVHLLLNVIETVGYGDQINRNGIFKPITSYIEAQFENYLNEELKIGRNFSRFHDSRVHACIYFICPTGHRLKSIDLFCMKQLQNKVNVIPVIGKSDSLTKTELQQFKLNIQRDLEENDIKIYQIPEADDDNRMSWTMPFAVAASDNYVSVGGKTVRGREFPWGTMLVEDEEHSEFLALKDMLIVSNMEDLKEKTHSDHYEHYRRHRLIELGFSEFSFEGLQKKRDELDEFMFKEEDSLRKMFVQRVKDMEKQLKERERLMRKEYDKEFKQLEKEMRDVFDRSERLEHEIRHFQKKVMKFDLYSIGDV